METDRKERALVLVVAGSAPLAYRLRKRLALPAPVTTAWLFAAPAAIAAGFPRSRLRDSAFWATQMWAYKNAFELPKDNERRHRRRAHIDYPLALDTAIGAGMPPGQRLQRRLRHSAHLTLLDKAATLFYLTWEAEPHLAMAWLRLKRPDAFPAAAGRLAVTFDLTLIPYWVLPTAPPWWASEQARRMDGEVQRVSIEVIRWLKGERPSADRKHAVGSNVFAAMPSDHFASAAMTAILVYEQDRRLGAAAWAYALTLALTLLYLGEHYVTDLAAGLALALSVNRARRPLQRIAEALLLLR